MTDSESRGAVESGTSKLLVYYLTRLSDNTRMLDELVKQVEALEKWRFVHRLFVRDLCRVLGLEPRDDIHGWITEAVRKLVEDGK